MAGSRSLPDRMEVLVKLQDPRVSEALPKEIIIKLLHDRVSLIALGTLGREGVTKRLSDKELLGITLNVAESVFERYKNGKLRVHDSQLLALTGNPDIMRRMPKEITDVLRAIKEREDAVYARALSDTEARVGGFRAVFSDSGWKELEERIRELRAKIN